MRKKIFIKQHDEKDCGAAAAAMICGYWGLRLPLIEFRGLVRTDNNGSTMWGLVGGLQSVGMNAAGLTGGWDDLNDTISKGELTFPFIARVIKDEILEHYIVIYAINKKKVTIGDPSVGIIKISVKQFMEIWTGHIICATPGEHFIPKNRTKNNLLRYLSLILEQKRLLGSAIILSLLISAITILGSGIFYVVVEDLTEEDTSYIQEETELTEVHQHDIEDENISFLESFSDSFLEWLDNLEFTMVLDEILFESDVGFLLILLLYLVKAVITFIRGRALAFLSKQVECDILFKSYSRLLQIPADFFDSHSTGEIMSRFEDISNICEAVSGGALTLVLDSIMVLLTGFILAILNLKLFVLSIFMILIYAFIILLFKNPIAHISQNVMAEHAIITSKIKQTVDGILPIKSFSKPKNRLEMIVREYDSYTNYKVKASLLETLQASLANLVAVAGLLLILWFGSWLCKSNELQLGILITFYNILNYFLTSVTNLILLQSDIQTAVVSAERLNDILDGPSESAFDSDRLFQNGNICFTNVMFRYGGAPLLFNGLNLTFQKGEKTAIIGESGCGKSTLAKLIGGFYTAESGTVSVSDMSLNEYSTDTIRKHIMYVSGDSQIFEDSIRNNIRMGDPEITDDLIVETCRDLLLDDFIHELPFGYDTLVDENGGLLSTGQRQRINIARALVRKPDILLLDEATSNLDPISEKQINTCLNALRGNTTCIVIAHKASAIRDCQRIYYMKQGNVIAAGTHAELLQTCPEYAQYAGE